MGKLLNRKSDQEPDTKGSNEEQYERLFPKIGRDFVYRDDLAKIIDQIMFILDPLGLTPVGQLGDTEARRRALEYKSTLDSGKDGSTIYRDLINLDDDEEEDEEK